MKSASTALATHLAQQETTLTTCLKLTRTDGKRLTFTSLDQPFEFDGDLYRTGYDPTAVVSTDQLNVDNLEWQGVVDHEELTSADIRAGLYDGATFEIFRVNWTDLTQGKLTLKTGTIGNIHLEHPDAGVAEGRSLAQALQVKIGMHYTAHCKWDLGDSRCKFNLQAPAVDDLQFWEPNQAYAVGDKVKPRHSNGFFFVVNQAGVSGDIEPDWEAGL